MGRTATGERRGRFAGRGRGVPGEKDHESDPGLDARGSRRSRGMRDPAQGRTVPADAAVSRPGANGPFLGTKGDLVVASRFPARGGSSTTMNASTPRRARTGHEHGPARGRGEHPEGPGRIRPGLLGEAALHERRRRRELRSPLAEEELHPGKPFPNKFTYGTGFAVSYQLDLFGQIARSVDAPKRTWVPPWPCATPSSHGGRGDDAGVSRGLRHRPGDRRRATAAWPAVAQHGSDPHARGARPRDEAGHRSLDRPGAAGAGDAAHPRGAAQAGGLSPGSADRADPGRLCRCRRDLRAGAVAQSALPVGDGAALLRRRPDVRRAEFESARRLGAHRRREGGPLSQGGPGRFGGVGGGAFSCLRQRHLQVLGGAAHLVGVSQPGRASRRASAAPMPTSMPAWRASMAWC
jgi:hypothetical protein